MKPPFVARVFAMTRFDIKAKDISEEMGVFISVRMTVLSFTFQVSEH